jgi:hypothetical protein
MEDVPVSRLLPPRAARTLGWALLSLGALGSCTPPATRYALEGSVTQVMNLGYDSVRVDITDPNRVRISFVRARATDETLPDGGTPDPSMVAVSEDYPFELTYALVDLTVPVKAEVDLTEAVVIDGGVTTQQRGVCSRNVLNDPRKTFPRIKASTPGAEPSGGLYLDREPVSNGSVSGNFHVTFEDGTEATSGRTVFGSFNATVSP